MGISGKLFVSIVVGFSESDSGLGRADEKRAKMGKKKQKKKKREIILMSHIFGKRII
jgi:hypothetical protein